MKSCISLILVFLFYCTSNSQSKKEDFEILMNDTIYKSLENSLEFSNDTNDTLICQISILKKENDKLRIIPDVMQFKTSVTQMNKWIVIIPNSKKKVTLDNSVLQNYHLRKGKYYFKFDVRYYSREKYKPYKILKKKFYYR